MILGLRSAIYPAPDLQAAKTWYEQVLERKPYFDEPFYVGFAVGGFELGLIPDGETGISGPQPLWGRRCDNADSAHWHACWRSVQTSSSRLRTWVAAFVWLSSRIRSAIASASLKIRISNQV